MNCSRAFTTRATFRWPVKAMRPQSPWIPNHRTTFRSKRLQTSDPVQHWVHKCNLFFDRCRNYSYRFASNLLLMFLQTKNSYSYDSHRCKSNKEEDKCAMTPTVVKYSAKASSEKSDRPIVTSSNTNLFAQSKVGWPREKKTKSLRTKKTSSQAVIKPPVAKKTSMQTTIELATMSW